MHQNISHLCHNLEIRHNWLELLDYYHQICRLFDNDDYEELRHLEGEDNFTCINAMIDHMTKFEQYIGSKHFSLLSQPKPLSELESTEQYTQEQEARMREIKNILSIYYPTFTALEMMPAKKIKATSAIKQRAIERSWQLLSFDIDLRLACCSLLERATLNREVHQHLRKICSKEIWTPHRATQRIAYVFERLHFIVSKLQSFIRLKISFEKQYSPELATLIQLSAITNDFECKIIKQKHAEEKRLSEIHGFSSSSGQPITRHH